MHSEILGGAGAFPGGAGVFRPLRTGLRDVRRFSHEAMATVYEVYACHADHQVRRPGRTGGVRPRRSSRAGAEPVPAEQRHHEDQSPRRRREHAGDADDAGVPGDRAAHVRPDLRRLRRVDRDRPALARARPRRIARSRHHRGCSARPRWHRQGLRRRSDGGGARRVGALCRARARRVQLRPRTRRTARPRRLAADAERSRCSIPGTGPPVHTTDGSRRLGRAQGRSHPGSTHRNTGPQAARGVGQRATPP